ncbi:sugar-binding domain-containing protein, partial [Staphylococcus aureus]|nr:sugar-binding domain-containing protein [Staphylococcus aureus]
VHVVPGDADNSQSVKTELGIQSGQLLEGILQEDAIVAVTGGSTMASVSEAIHLLPYTVFFVPARGGLGENVVFQS